MMSVCRKLVLFLINNQKMFYLEDKNVKFLFVRLWSEKACVIIFLL